MEHLTAGMSLEAVIGQCFMVGFDGASVTPEITDLIERSRVGGVILFSRNIHDARQTLALTSRLQEIARAAGHRFPLLIATDQENGMVRRLGPEATIFPGNMALGAIGSEEITCEIAQATGRELKALGFNMNLAPDADVNNNPANPVIGVRSFGEDPQQVARLVAAAVKGYRAAGVVSTLKHFPGHGDTATDSHRALPSVPHTLERLRAIELVPFQSGITAGAECVMTAHLALPTLLPDPTLPATISSAVLRGLLREQLGFQGMVISDCLEMDAIAQTIGVEQGAVQALHAGVDLVLVSHRYDRQRHSLESVQASVQDEKLSPETVTQAAERVLRLKQRLLSWEALPDEAALSQLGSAAHQHLRNRAYALSTTLVRNADLVLPLHLQPGERIMVLVQRKTALSQAEDGRYPDQFLAESIQQRHSKTSMVLLPSKPTTHEIEQALQEARDSDVIIAVMMNAHQDQPQAELLHHLIATGHPVIGVSVAQPYDTLALPHLRTALATYEYTPPALAAAVGVLFGEIEPRGHLPVSLPGGM